MHVLMTGGTGMLGRALAASLLEDGHEVTVLTRDPDQKTRLAPRARLVAWDAQSTEGWAHLMEESDVVVHMAGEGLADGRWSNQRKERIRDSRVVSGHALVAAIRQAERRPSALIQSSAIGFYGPRKDEVVDERAGPGSDFLAHICFQWETATAEVERMGVRRAVTRSGIVLTTEGGALPRMLLPYRLYAGGRIGSGKQWWSWIHMDDEIRALRFLIDRSDAAGPFNLTAPNPVTNREFAVALGSAMGRPSRLPVPAFALQTLYGEMSTVLLDGQRVVPARLLELGFEFLYPALDGALAATLAQSPPA